VPFAVALVRGRCGVQECKKLGERASHVCLRRVLGEVPAGMARVWKQMVAPAATSGTSPGSGSTCVASSHMVSRLSLRHSKNWNAVGGNRG
jgi:hypothetical protein